MKKKEGLSMPSPLRAKKLTELLIDEIKVLIEADSLQPGDKIPTEQELMRIFKVSRTCVREALSVLRQEGVVEIIQGKGTFLKKHYTPLPDMADPSSSALAQFMEARKVLESSLARLAAERASDEELDRMESVLSLLEGTDADLAPDRVVQSDLDFHYSLAKAAGNPVLLHLLQEVDSHLQTGRSTTITFPQGRKKALEGHKRVLQALQRRSPDDAALQMARHIDEIEKAQRFIMALQDGPVKDGAG
jgi:GntR family transcriptional repressor for pyruvate dehydrogenase complex